MSRPIKIAAPGAIPEPAASFDTPLAMLEACHRRVEDQCATLQRLVPHLEAHGSDQAASEAAAAVVRYFDLAGPKHHADEEEDLFPALLESMAGSDAVCLRGIIDALQADHRALDRQWHAIRKVLRQVIERKPARLDAAAVSAFASQYQAHIDREEGELLPMADRLLSPHAITQMARAMRSRRGDTTA